MVSSRRWTTGTAIPYRLSGRAIPILTDHDLGAAMNSSPGRWTAAAIPDLSGRAAVVTGANTGLGFHTARLLAGRGAQTVLACRDLDRAEAAAARIRTAAPDAQLSIVRLDLASLASVRAAAATLRER